MKKNLLLFIFVLFCFSIHIQCYAQPSAMVGISSGYNRTAYNMKGYNPVEYVPICISAAIGSNGIQIGPDFWTTVSRPVFKFKDSLSGKELYTEKINDTYFGGMIRAHAGNDSRDFAVIFRVGVGVFFSKKTIDYTDYYLMMFPNLADGTYKFKNSIGYNGAFGFSIPLGEGHIYIISSDNIHITLEGVFNYNPRKYDNITNYHTSWGIQVGVSYNFFNFENY